MASGFTLLTSTAPRGSCVFFFNVSATTEIYTLSLHDALPIWASANPRIQGSTADACSVSGSGDRSEEHTSELQSQFHLVCRLLLEKKNNQIVTLSNPVPRADFPSTLRPLRFYHPQQQLQPHFL